MNTPIAPAPRIEKPLNIVHIMIILFISLFLIAVAYGVYGKLHAAEIAVRQEFGPLMKDEESLRIRNAYVTEGNVVCAEINAKNGFGAYAGWKPVMIMDGVPKIIDDDSTLTDLEYFIANCNK